MKAFKTHVQTHANHENELKPMQGISEKEEARRDEKNRENEREEGRGKRREG